MSVPVSYMSTTNNQEHNAIEFKSICQYIQAIPYLYIPFKEDFVDQRFHKQEFPQLVEPFDYLQYISVPAARSACIFVMPPCGAYRRRCIRCQSHTASLPLLLLAGLAHSYFVEIWSGSDFCCGVHSPRRRHLNRRNRPPAGSAAAVRGLAVFRCFVFPC